MPQPPTRLKLFRKTVLASIVVGLLPLLLAFTLSYRFEKQTIQRTMGSAFQVLAQETGGKLGLLIEDLLDRAQQLARSEALAKAVLRANERYAGMSPEQRKSAVAAAEATWSAPPARPALDRSAARELEEFRRHSPSQYHIVLVTDREGALVAASPNGSVAHYDHRSDPEWDAAFDGGRGRVYLGDITWNAELAAYTLNAAVPIRHNAEVVGMVLVIHTVDRLFRSVTDVRIGRTDHTMLANNDGTLLFCPIFQIKNHTLSPILTNELFQPQPGWNITRADVHYPGRPALNGFAPVRLRTLDLSSKSLGGKQWFIFTSQNPDETFSPLRDLFFWTALAAGLGLVILVVLAVLVVRKIVRPIMILQERARAISQGIRELPRATLDAPPASELPNMSIQTGDEIEDLAGMFSEMARVLQSTRQLLATTTRRLEEMAITDELTGLYNRRHAWDELRAELSRSVRFNLNLSCISMDLDFFKQVNDHYGHAGGDDALRQFANLLRRNFREPDLLARVGGEEFLAVLPQTDSQGARAKAELLRKQVEEAEFAVGQGRVIHMTVSLGVATFPDPRIKDINDLLKVADDALYRAKGAGRNQVILG